MFGEHSLPILRKGDVEPRRRHLHRPGGVSRTGRCVRAGAKVMHIDLNAYEIAKNHPVDIGMVADPKLTLALLATRSNGCCPTRRETRRRRASSRRGKDKDGEARGGIEAGPGGPRRGADEDVALHGGTRRRSSRATRHLRRGADELAGGVAVPAAVAHGPVFPDPRRLAGRRVSRARIGVKLANPDKTVVGFSGDGGSMYTIQALWTAARHNIDVEVRGLQQRVVPAAADEHRPVLARAGDREARYPLSFDLSQPPLKFAEIAQALSVPAVRVEKPWEIGPAIRQALASPGPFLIDLVLEGDTHPERVGNTCGQ